MNIDSITTDEIFSLSEDELYGLLGEAGQKSSQAYQLLGGMVGKDHIKRVVAFDFVRKFKPEAQGIADGKKINAQIWQQIKSQVCETCASDYRSTDNKTLFDALVAALAALIFSNPLVVIVLALAIRTGRISSVRFSRNELEELAENTFLNQKLIGNDQKEVMQMNEQAQ